MTTATATATERTYVFCPEEPDSFINLPGSGGSKLARFQNGRLMSDRDGLTQYDIDWIRKRNSELKGSDQSRPDPFVIVEGQISTAQMMDLQRRVMAACARKAAATRVEAIADDVQMTMLRMLSDDTGIPNVKLISGIGMQEILSRVLPSVGADPILQRLVASESAQIADERAISAGLAGKSLDDIDQPKADGADDLPSGFAPPSGFGAAAGADFGAIPRTGGPSGRTTPEKLAPNSNG